MRFIAPAALRFGRGFIAKSALVDTGIVKHLLINPVYVDFLLYATAASILVETFGIGTLKTINHRRARRYLMNPQRNEENPRIDSRLNRVLCVK